MRMGDMKMVKQDIGKGNMKMGDMRGMGKVPKLD